jgi:hypothetical protein
MRNRVLVAATVLLACAFAVQGQVDIFKIELVPSGAMVSMDEPVLKDGTYVFTAWPDRTLMTLKSMRVRKVTRLTGRVHETVYQLELIPTGTVLAKDNPVLKGDTYVLRTWRDGKCMSLRQTDVRKINALTGDKAFWAEQAVMGASQIGSLAMQGGGKFVEIGTSGGPGGSSQAGPANLNSLGSNNGANSQGNWYYEGTPGVSDAWAPANALINSPGDVPRMAGDANARPH